MIGMRSTTSLVNARDRRRNDISRLLDPSYNTSYYRSNQRQSTYGAYVDAHGDLHDPDYRHFPLINKSHRNQPGATRPHWELIDEDLALQSDDDEEFQEDFGYNKRNSYSSSSTRYTPPKTRQPHYYTSTRTSLNSPNSAGVYSTSGAPSAYVPGSPVSTFSSSVSSTSSVLSRSNSPFDEDSPKEKSRCRITALKRKRRQSSVATLDREHEEDRAKLARRVSHEFVEEASEGQLRWNQEDQQRNRFVEDVEEEEEEEEREQEREGERVPTCADVLRRQWQALSLRIRFGMFRAERRIKRRVQSLI